MQQIEQPIFAEVADRMEDGAKAGPMGKAPETTSRRLFRMDQLRVSLFQGKMWYTSRIIFIIRGRART